MIMTNELILLLHILLTAFSVIIAHRMGEKALVALVALSMVMANLFVIKQIELCGFGATTADALDIGAMLGLNMLQEFYSRESARQAIGITFAASIFFVITAHLHLWYLPSACDITHEHFVPILSNAPAIVIDSMMVYVLSQFVDYALYGSLQQYWHKRFLVVRNYVSIGISQLLDTIMFTGWLKLLGIIDSFWHIVIVSFAIKFVITLIATPIIAYAARGVRA